MKKKLAEKIVKHWNENFAESTAATKTKAVLYEGINSYSVEIIPDGEVNDGTSFHHTEELVAVTNCFKVNSYVGILDGKTVVARIF